MTKLLIVEDEKKVLRILSDYLVSEDYEVVTAGDGETGLKLATEVKPDLILLDVMLPKKSGYDVCRELRQKGHTTPVIMVTAKGQEIDRVTGLELGADDYVTKPFSLTELNARIRAVLRRVGQYRTGQKLDAYQVGEVTIDFKRQEVRRRRTVVSLSSMEATLMQYFLLHKGDALTREQILNDVWGYDAYPTTRTIDTHVWTLRQKIESNPEKPRHILTVHGAGYRYME